MCGKTLRGTALQTERFQWEKCVFLVILGLEIHIFVVNVHFFPGRGQHLPGKCVFFPKSGNLCRIFKRCLERPSAGYRMADRGRNVRKFQALPARQGPSEEPPRRSPPLPSSGAERGGSKALLVGQGPSEEPLRRSPLDKGLSGGAPKGSPFDRGPTHQPAPVALPPASRQTHQPVQPRCRHVPFALHAIRT